MEDAIRGNVDIVQAFIYAQTDPRLEIMNLPALVTTFDELKAAYGDPNSKLNTILAGIMSDHGLVYLGNIGEGLIGIVASERPTDHAGFGDKGVNIRVWSSDIAKKTRFFRHCSPALLTARFAAPLNGHTRPSPLPVSASITSR